MTRHFKEIFTADDSVKKPREKQKSLLKRLDDNLIFHACLTIIAGVLFWFGFAYNMVSFIVLAVIVLSVVAGRAIDL